MKRIFSLLILFIVANNTMFAQDTAIKIQGSKVPIVGYKKSNIKLVTYANKPIGNMVTYTAFNSNEVTASFYVTSKGEGVYSAYVQTIPLNGLAGLIPQISVNKSFIDPEQQTNPKQTWDVSIAFKKKNGNYIEVGNTVEYRISYDGKPKMVSEKYEGTQRLIPFVTKKLAEEFVANLKLALNK